MSRSRPILATPALALLLALASATAAGAATLPVTPVRSIPMPYPQTSHYSIAADGTIWTASGSGSSTLTIGHVDDEGNDRGDGFTENGGGTYEPTGIGFYGGRVYVGDGSSHLNSYRASDGGDLVGSDAETAERMDHNGFYFHQIAANGAVVGPTGFDEVATLDLTELTTAHPFYPQVWMGAGINQPSAHQAPFESCQVGVPGEGGPATCGVYGGDPSSDAGFDDATDAAAAPGGIFVTEGDADRVTFVITEQEGGPTIGYRFGGPGTGESQLGKPVSITRQASSGDLYVAEEDNARISIFAPGGGYIASLGYGVADGGDGFQACGPEIAACLPAVSYLADPRSYFTQVDFAPDGDLFVYEPVADQVLELSAGEAGGGGETGGGTPGSGGGPAPGAPPIAPLPGPAKPTVHIKAAPLKVAKGKKTTLTAVLAPAGGCQNLSVLFQVRRGNSWKNLGSRVKPGANCEAKLHAKIAAKSVFRAILVSPAQATLATSTGVTVKLAG